MTNRPNFSAWRILTRRKRSGSSDTRALLHARDALGDDDVCWHSGLSLIVGITTLPVYVDSATQPRCIPVPLSDLNFSFNAQFVRSIA